MLVLSRHKDEQIVINGGFENGGITLTVVGIRGDRVRIGIAADKDVPVHRREVFDAIARENAGRTHTRKEETKLCDS